MEYVISFFMYSPCVIYQLMLIVRYVKQEKKCPLNYFIMVNIFLLYLYMIFDVTGIGTLKDLMNNGVRYMNIINIRPFDSIGIGFFLNIIMFMPFVFLVPFIWREYRYIVKTVAVGAIFTLLIEISQLINYRVTDIDDFMTNIFGTVIGYLIWKTFTQVFKVHIKVEIKNKWEPLTYIILAITGIFLFYKL